MIDKVEFELELPDGEETKIVKSTDLTDGQYALATQMQALQTQVQNLAALCPTSQWDGVFASQYDSVITNPPDLPVPDPSYVIPS